ncbi:MAG: hypothetical protein J6M60_07230 [Clostridia bacterium]|nr:hypothetical protein [Clostridia bacterium]
MGIASLVLGIISMITGFVPFCGSIAFLPALIGLILGIIDIVKKSKSNEKKGLAIAGTVMCAVAILVIFFWVFVAAAGSGANNTNTITTSELVSQTEQETTPSSNQADYIEVDYETLYQEYQDNPIAADAKYKGKKLQLTGDVSDIDREIAGNTYINFEVGFLQNVRLTFKKSEESKVAQLSKGQTVTVRGICKGTLISTTVSLTDCELVN